THQAASPPTFTRDERSGFFREPRQEQDRDPVVPPGQDPLEGKALGSRDGGLPPNPATGSTAADGTTSSSNETRVARVEDWAEPARAAAPPGLPKHAELGSWHPSDMLIGLEPGSGL